MNIKHADTIIGYAVLKKFDVLCLGDINLDILYYIDSLPSLGGESTASKMVISPGGAAANVATALARLGFKVGFIGALGRDIIGKFLYEELIRENIDVSNIVWKSEFSGIMSIAVTRGGERTIMGFRGANKFLNPEDVNEAYAGFSKAVFISGYAFLEEPQRSSALKVISFARECNVKIFIDVCEPLASYGVSRLSKIIGKVFCTFLNLREYNILFENREDNVKNFLKKYSEIIVVKMGKEGAEALTSNFKVKVKAFNVKVVDTTGAGDAFDAGFIAGVLKHLSLREALILANALAAWKCQGYGARHLPRLYELKEFLKVSGYERLAETL